MLSEGDTVEQAILVDGPDDKVCTCMSVKFMPGFMFYRIWVLHLSKSFLMDQMTRYTCMNVLESVVDLISTEFCRMWLKKLKFQVTLRNGVLYVKNKIMNMKNPLELTD